MIKSIKPVIDHSVRKLCLKSYYNHKKGCPNFNHKKGCPPSSPLIEDVFNMDGPFYVLYNKFPIGAHIKRMRSKHLNWSQKQLECCLYWQGKARKQLKEIIESFKIDTLYYDTNWIVETCPEAMGLNVTLTMASIGEHLEWPPVNYAYQVALAGVAK